MNLPTVVAVTSLATTVLGLSGGGWWLAHEFEKKASTDSVQIAENKGDFVNTQLQDAYREIISRLEREKRAAKTAAEKDDIQRKIDRYLRKIEQLQEQQLK